MTEVNGYVHLALSCLYCMATKEKRSRNEIKIIAKTMQKILDMDRRLRTEVSDADSN